VRRRCADKVCACNAAICESASRSSSREIARRSGGLLSRARVEYWRRKRTNPAFHPGGHGGFRWRKLSAGRENLVKARVRHLLRARRALSTKQISDDINQVFAPSQFSRTYVHRILRSWHWTSHGLDIRKIEKFSPENCLRYLNYILWVTQEMAGRWRNLVFLDESSFNGSDIQPRRGYGPANARITTYQPDARHSDRFSLLLMARIAQDPLYCQVVRDQAVTAEHFLTFVSLAIQAGYLHAGDILVLDNARIHFAENILPHLRMQLALHGILLVRLPAYSMECNPCEDVFGYVKRMTRETSQSNSLLEEVKRVLRLVTEDLIRTYFYNCIFVKWQRV